MMTNKKIWLALWWGATKWFVHIGVIKYLQEQGYEITSIAGTSIGAIIGTLLAAGIGYQQITQHAKLLNYRDLIDIDFGTWLVKGDKIITKIKDIVWDITFADLDIPLCIIATSINTGQEKVFNSWSVLDAIRCSMSLPGIFSLVSSTDLQDWYVDGGLVNSLPVSHVDMDIADQIVAVSCMWLASFDQTSKKTFMGVEIDTSRWTLPKKILMRSHYIMMARNEDLELVQHTDVQLIRPELEHISSFDLDVVDTAIQIGYDEARRVLN